MPDATRIAKLIWEHFALTFSALLPLVNPIGSALIFLGLVGTAPVEVFRSLARRIAINAILVLLVVDLVGETIIGFFGISLPIVQFSGGLVIAAMAWSLLNQSDSSPSAEKAQAAAAAGSHETSPRLWEKSFYPFTFPITVGPGSCVVMLTLSARMRERPFVETVFAQIGTLIACALLAVTVYLAYAYAPRLAKAISPSTAHGILRIIAFILLCIGVQIAWNGLSHLLATVLRPPAS
jgi:multiple antibiotic resistance protein